MVNDHGHIVLVTGDAPYLGGHATWLPLRQAMPEFEFVEVDLLGSAGERANPVDTARDMVRSALSGARAVIAHGTAATIAIEAVASIDPSIAVLLLSPRIITRQSLMLRAIRAFAGGLGANVLTGIARSKRRRLMADSAYLRKQLGLLVRDDIITDALLEEARARTSDPRMDLVDTRTAETIRALLIPIDIHASEAVSNRVVLFGDGPIDRKARVRAKCVVLKDAWSAPMLEQPHAVAEHLRALIAGRVARYTSRYPQQKLTRCKPLTAKKLEE